MFRRFFKLYLWGSVCVTIKSGCPIQIFRKMMKYLKIWYRLLVYLTSFTVCSGDKKKLWKWPVLVIFRAFFIPRPLIWQRIPVNQLIKDSGLREVNAFSSIWQFCNHFKLFHPAPHPPPKKKKKMRYALVQNVLWYQPSIKCILNIQQRHLLRI